MQRIEAWRNRNLFTIMSPHSILDTSMIHCAPLHRSLSLAVLLFVLHGSSALADTTVQSLSGVRGALQTRDAKRMFDHSMSGTREPDGFGTKLPAGFTAAYLVEQLAPGQDVRSVVLAGAKPWPLRPNSYVAMICLADSPTKAAAARKDTPASCDSLSGGDAKVWFGVFESAGDGALRLVARTESRVVAPTDWLDTNIDPPVSHGDSNDLTHRTPPHASRTILSGADLNHFARSFPGSFFSSPMHSA